MHAGPLVGIVIGTMFLGKSLYELKSRKAFGKSGVIRCEDAPSGYWVIVLTSIFVGAFVLYLSIIRSTA